MRRLVPAAALCAAVLAGCGGDGSSERAVTVGASETVEVVGTEYAFDPETLVVRGSRGGGPVPVTIRFRDRGSQVHNLVVMRDGQEVDGTKTIPPGQQATVELSLQPGEYRFVCTVGQHAERGMVGELAVE